MLSGPAEAGIQFRARYPSGKGEVCKTFMRRFDSDPRLQICKTPIGVSRLFATGLFTVQKFDATPIGRVILGTTLPGACLEGAAWRTRLSIACKSSIAGVLAAGPLRRMVSNEPGKKREFLEVVCEAIESEGRRECSGQWIANFQSVLAAAGNLADVAPEWHSVLARWIIRPFRKFVRNRRYIQNGWKSIPSLEIRYGIRVAWKADGPIQHAVISHVTATPITTSESRVIEEEECKLRRLNSMSAYIAAHIVINDFLSNGCVFGLGVHRPAVAA
jgi:hypothetical protein